MALVSILLPGAYIESGDSNTHLAGWTEGDTWGLRIETLGRRDSVGTLPGEYLQPRIRKIWEETEMGD
jgi:hypothetical protein